MKNIIYKITILAIAIVAIQVIFVGGSTIINFGHAQVADVSTEVVSAPSDTTVVITDLVPVVDTTIVDIAPTDTSAPTTDTTDESVLSEPVADITTVDTAPADSSEPTTGTTDESAAAVDTTTTDAVVAPVVTDPAPSVPIEIIVPPTSQPTLTTDKADYEPGETANIFGNFFLYGRCPGMSKLFICLGIRRCVIVNSGSIGKRIFPRNFLFSFLQSVKPGG